MKTFQWRAFVACVSALNLGCDDDDRDDFTASSAAAGFGAVPFNGATVTPPDGATEPGEPAA